MNANTRLRLWKEARALLPMWAAMAALIALPFLIRAEQPMSYAIAAYWFGCAVLGPVIVGQEFQHRTMGLLLSQPVSRRRLWWEKMVVLAVSLICLLVWMEVLWGVEVGRVPVFAATGEILFKSLWLLFLPLLLGLCTGPVMTLLARGIIGGAALTFIGPWFLFLLCMAVFHDRYARTGWDYPIITFFASATCYSIALLAVGARRFHRLEDNRSQPQELWFPTVQELRVKWTGVLFVLGVRRSPIPLATNHLQVEKVTTSCEQSATPLISQPTRSSQRSSLEHLVRKEIRLQQPAIVVAVCLVALWLTLLAGVTTRLITDKGFLILPLILLGLGIPVLVGVVSTAEERSLGVHEWHLTLPVSARRQWGVKVLVALGVNVVLGLVLPGLLAHASSWLAKNSQLVADIAGSDLSPFRTVNLILISAALYASTASANSMRALTGTIVLFLVGAMVLNFADFVVHSNSSLVASWSPREWRTDSFTMVVWLYQSRWPLVWAGLAAWLFVLGLTSYRRSLESVWQPVRRMMVFFAVVCAFVFAAIVW